MKFKKLKNGTMLNLLKLTDNEYGVSLFQNPEVYPSHKTMFSRSLYDIYAYDLENFFYF